ncbi:hypothetical protein TCAL_09698 [Tigriopus californicus]|uniref:C3H1-type domain-containing protein n=1 Tax=Tigriopus californicus TaxID=6832 RepID=A0A553NNH7_TIGCA|nr:hypothetical protein TCAL_09698 [Tigriopus californicus]
MAYMGIPTNPTLSGMAASQQHPFLAMSNPLALAAANSAGAVANSAPTIINVGALMNQKDSRWLQLEVCREYQRNKCSRSDGECKFAHPPESIEIQNGRVTACYDSIKGRCNREKPPCKYFHPPQHLKDQLLINGRNHLALKNAVLQQYGFVGQQGHHSIRPHMHSMTLSSVPPSKRPASDKSGTPVFHCGSNAVPISQADEENLYRASVASTPTTMVAVAAAAAAAAGGLEVGAHRDPNLSSVAAYQQALMQLHQQQPFVPIPVHLQSQLFQGTTNGEPRNRTGDWKQVQEHTDNIHHPTFNFKDIQQS